MSGKRWALVFFANVSAVIILLVGTELFLRWHINRTTVFEEESHYRYDDKLGWVPKPGRYTRDYGTVTIDPDGFRRCPSAPATEGREKILACGDSFTFGWFISDDETWPCYLSAIADCRVVNAAVPGYGLDQIVLRMQEVIGKVAPDLVIVSLIMDDVARCEMSKRDRYKPYYEIVEGQPVLRNSPVPPPAVLVNSPRWYEKLVIVNRLAALAGKEQEKNVVIRHNRGMEIARYLFRKARDLARRNGSRLMVVIQPEYPALYEEGREMSRDLENFLGSLDIPILNLYPLMERAFQTKAEREALFSAQGGHPGGPGNRWVAEEIADFITRCHLLSGRPIIPPPIRR